MLRRLNPGRQHQHTQGDGVPDLPATCFPVLGHRISALALVLSALEDEVPLSPRCRRLMRQLVIASVKSFEVSKRGDMDHVCKMYSTSDYSFLASL